MPRKSRLAEWEQFGIKSHLPPKDAPVRVFDLHAFADLEVRLLYLDLNDLPAEVDEDVQHLSEITFGITRLDTEFCAPSWFWNALTDVRRFQQTSDYWEMQDFERVQHQLDAFERRFETEDRADEDKVDILLRIGWDFRNDRGLPLRCTRLFSRQIEAAAKGIAGRLPKRSELFADQIGKSLEEEAQAFLAKRPRKAS